MSKLMSKLMSFVAVAGLLMAMSAPVSAMGGGAGGGGAGGAGAGAAGAAGGVGGVGGLGGSIGGIQVWQTPQNEPGWQARHEMAPGFVMQSYGSMRYPYHHRHHHHYQ